MSSTTDSPRFPDWFPPHCPTAATVEASGVVFRFVASNPTDPSDFLSHHELGLAPTAKPCSRCSLSVYDNRKAAIVSLKSLRNRYPNRFGRYIAEGALDANHGKMKQVGTNVSHLEWWAYEGVERHLLFQVVETLEI